MGLRISRKVFKMKTEIIDTISECSRYSPSEINKAFDYVGSFDLVVEAVGKLSRNFITKGSVVYDIGCSTGATSDSIKESNAERSLKRLRSSTSFA